jgi:hypothetical protein
MYFEKRSYFNNKKIEESIVLLVPPQRGYSAYLVEVG